MMHACTECGHEKRSIYDSYIESMSPLLGWEKRKVRNESLPYIVCIPSGIVILTLILLCWVVGSGVNDTSVMAGGLILGSIFGGLFGAVIATIWDWCRHEW